MRSVRAGVVGLVLVASAGPLAAATLKAVDVATSESNQILWAEARFDVEFSDAMVEALESGVKLTIDIDIEVVRAVRFWVDDVVTQVRHSYAIELHALSDRFVVTDEARSEQWSFQNLVDVIAFLEHPPAMPFAEKKIFQSGQKYSGRLRARLDVESLPAPLRPVAYISPSWWLSSDWLAWPIRL